MHFQYLVRNEDLTETTQKDSDRIMCFLHRQEGRVYSAYASGIGLDVVNFKDETQGILPEHMEIIKKFGYKLEPVATETYTKVLKERYPEPAIGR